MAFPTGWPPRVASGVRSIRAYVTATATANYNDRAYLWHQLTGANPYTALPNVRPGGDVSAPDYNGPHVVPASPAGTGESSPDDPEPMIWSSSIRIINKGGTVIYFSFDGTNDHGEVAANSELLMRNVYEAGIAIRGSGNVFVVFAW